MAIIKNKDTQQNQDFWSHVEAVAKEVSAWPTWMGNRSASTEKENTSQDDEMSASEHGDADDHRP